MVCRDLSERQERRTHAALRFHERATGVLTLVWDVGDGGKPQAPSQEWFLAQRRGSTECTAQRSLRQCSTGDPQHIASISISDVLHTRK